MSGFEAPSDVLTVVQGIVPTLPDSARIPYSGAMVDEFRDLPWGDVYGDGAAIARVMGDEVNTAAQCEFYFGDIVDDWRTLRFQPWLAAHEPQVRAVLHRYGRLLHNRTIREAVDVTTIDPYEVATQFVASSLCLRSILKPTEGTMSEGRFPLATFVEPLVAAELVGGYYPDVALSRIARIVRDHRTSMSDVKPPLDEAREATLAARQARRDARLALKLGQPALV